MGSVLLKLHARTSGFHSLNAQCSEQALAEKHFTPSLHEHLPTDIGVRNPRKP